MTSNVKECFISRYKGGKIIEADYSQLEVIVLAHVTKDEQLISDLLSGIDMHTHRAAELFFLPLSHVTPQQRTIAKRLSFQLQYGSGAKNMSEKLDIPLDMAQRFIKNYYDRYPDVRKWQQETLASVEKASTPIRKHTPKGWQVRGAYLKSSDTGRKYVFETSDSPEWMRERGRHTTFSPTKIKNYPIQGWATGDIVPMMVGKISRWIYTNNYEEDVKLINTVHDSIVLDCKGEMVYTISTEIKKLMEDAPKYIKDQFGCDFKLPLKVEVTAGDNWKDQQEIV